MSRVVSRTDLRQRCTRHGRDALLGRAPAPAAAVPPSGLVAGGRDHRDRLLALQPGPQRDPASRPRSRSGTACVQHLQDILHLNFELSVNHCVAAHEWLAQIMDYYYATLHFIVTIGVLVWLFVQRPHIYRGARTVLFTPTLIALAGFYLYPLAPPRLLPQYGYIDTLVKFHTWGSLADPEIAEHSNQYAAMPSLHIAWALWCGHRDLHVRAADVGARARPALPVLHRCS